MAEFIYEWQWRVQISGPPPQKTCGSNNGGWAGARSLYLSNVNFAGVDVVSNIRQLKAGNTVRVEHKTDSGVWSLWTLAVDPIEYGGTYCTFPSSALEYHGVPVDNLVYRVVLTSGEVATTKISMGDHLRNLSFLAGGMLKQENICLETVGDDAIKVYDKMVNAYLNTPELPQPVPRPATPGDREAMKTL